MREINRGSPIRFHKLAIASIVSGIRSLFNTTRANGVLQHLTDCGSGRWVTQPVNSRLVDDHRPDEGVVQ